MKRPTVEVATPWTAKLGLTLRSLPGYGLAAGVPAVAPGLSLGGITGDCGWPGQYSCVEDSWLVALTRAAISARRLLLL